jgi:hypothetical protein
MLCDDIWHYICDYLNVGDTIALSQVNKNLRSIKQYKLLSTESFMIVIKNNISYYYTNHKPVPLRANRKLSEIYCIIYVHQYSSRLTIRSTNNKDLIFIFSHGDSDFHKLNLFLSENNICIANQ